MDINKLAEPFDTSLISWRVGATTKDKTKGIALAYIDARDVMQRLDDVCGIENWQCRYSHANNKTICEVGIKIGDEWVWKANGAGDTQVEAEKGAISDAFKRAAVLWGIGRYLYDVQNVWVELKAQGRSYAIANPSDSRLVCALEKAAVGIRVQDEKKPEVNFDPVEPSEISLLEDILKEAINEEELKAAWTNVYKAKERMQPFEYEALEKLKDVRKDVLSEKAHLNLTPDDQESWYGKN